MSFLDSLLQTAAHSGSHADPTTQESHRPERPGTEPNAADREGVLGRRYRGRSGRTRRACSAVASIA